MSDLESSLARAVGERSDPAVVQPATAIEDGALDAGVPRAARQQFAGCLRTRRLVVARDLAVAHVGERAGRDIVDELRVDELVGPVHRQTGTRTIARDLLANPGMTALARRSSLVPRHQAAPVFAALPAFLRTYSPSYRMPLPL